MSNEIQERVDTWLLEREQANWFALPERSVRRSVLRKLWRDVSAQHGAESLPAAGVLLGLAREACRRDVFAEHHGDGIWRVHQAHREYVLGMGRTEIAALVSCLELSDP
jgi:hypothetical protein